MCLFTTCDNFKTATRDITCWKVFRKFRTLDGATGDVTKRILKNRGEKVGDENDILVSPYRLAPYQLKYDANRFSEKAFVGVYLDKAEAYETYCPETFISVTSNALHTYKTKDYAKKQMTVIAKQYSMKRGGLVIKKCIIPKDTHYAVSYDGVEYASEQLIVLK